MERSVLLSIRPEWLEKILNGKKTIEIRKVFPKNYVGWVYLYCSKAKPYLYETIMEDEYFTSNTICEKILNGKVVARFWCDKVEEIRVIGTNAELNQATQLNDFEIWSYLKGKMGYSINITKLEIFDKPKELNEFFCKNPFETKAPQNYCYVYAE
jgi:predicted transcriptional regulator